MIRSVYLHAPFCRRRCFYCDFAVTVSQKGDLDGWLEGLRAELGLLQEEGAFVLASTLDTVFVGGGTPSVLGGEAMAGLARVLGVGRLQNPGLEWTVEANPESFTREVAEGWAAAGVNRVSLGAQSFQAEPLEWMGRLHGPEGPREAIAKARRAGISNLSLDLIFGLPEAVPRDWGKELDTALSLEVPHLSLYGLTAEEGTPLGRMVKEGATRMVEDERYGEEFLLASRKLTEAGYRHYEVSNFALPGFECRHNQVYWDLEPYLGLGSSAHSFSHPTRRWNKRSWADYQKAVMAGTLPREGEELLTPRQARLEELWLGLRKDRGLESEGLSEAGRVLVSSWVKKGWAWEEDGRVGLTAEGWLILDDLTVGLHRSEDPDGDASPHSP